MPVSTTSTETQPPVKRAVRKRDLHGPLTKRIWGKLNGEEGTGLAISFLIHALLLALLAIPVSRTLREQEIITTVVQQDASDESVFAGPIDTNLAAEPDTFGVEKLAVPILDPVLISDELTVEAPIVDQPTLLGEDGGDDGDGNHNTFRVADPANAIQVGNFSVWPWPVEKKIFEGDVRHGEPGSAPKVQQSYHIVIRIKVDPNRRSVPLSEFSGEVIGTDNYRQKIPDEAYFYTKNGELVPAKKGRRIPVIDGIVELLIHVPGASIPQIRDTIRVYSRSLDEEQTIELVFQPRE